MKKNKILDFTAVNKKESLFSQITGSAPYDAADKIQELMAQPAVEDFLINKLKASTNDTIDLVCFLIESLTDVPDDIPAKELLSNDALPYYQKKRIYRMCKSLLIQDILSPEQPNLQVHNEKIKRDSLMQMLEMAQAGQAQAASIVNELIEQPKSNIMSMLDYIGNFSDSRVFLLLGFFAVAQDKDIKKTAIRYIGFLQDPATLGFLKDALEANKDKGIRQEIINAMQKTAYSSSM